jgi:hypothetical protein
MHDTVCCKQRWLSGGGGLLQTAIQEIQNYTPRLFQTVIHRFRKCTTPFAANSDGLAAGVVCCKLQFTKSENNFARCKLVLPGCIGTLVIKTPPKLLGQAV